MYVASLHVVNQQKVCLLPEVVKPSMAVYDTVAECDLSRQNSRTCAEAVPRWSMCQIQLPKSCRCYTNFSNKLNTVKFVYKQ